MVEHWPALMLTESDQTVRADLVNINDEMLAERLPNGDVTILTEFSSFNYKDGMVIKGQGKLVRQYPHIPGIDLIGWVVDSAHDDIKKGDTVILTGWHVGERYWGGFAGRARVNGDWLVSITPAMRRSGLTAERAMIFGTAGFTAMLAVMALEQNNIAPESGPILVTGAGGGVGSCAVMLLNRLGYQVVAATGRAELGPWLRDMGASDIITREELLLPAKPLESERWAGMVDTVGGPILANALASMRYDGTVAACGLTAGVALHTTVIPFLLRGVRLIGIDSVMHAQRRRRNIWQRLAELIDPERMDRIVERAGLSDLPALADRILAGDLRGRYVINVRQT